MATSNSQASPVPLHIVLVVFVDFVFIANAVVFVVDVVFVVFVVFFVDVVFVVIVILCSPAQYKPNCQHLCFQITG